MVAYRKDTLAKTLAALGHPMRLSLVERLSTAETFAGLSITELTENSGLTRQAITKHLEALEKAGLLSRLRLGRATWYELNIDSIRTVTKALATVADQRANSKKKLKASERKFLGMLTSASKTR